MRLQSRTTDLSGTNYEIGKRLGQITAAIPILKQRHTEGIGGFSIKQQKDAEKLFDRYCPGLTEELYGFAEGLEVEPERLFFYTMTYLTPRCSQIAISPCITESGKPLLARNYEFSHKAEDFCLARTSVRGKYTHMGTTVLHFGRDDGFNEHGLAVTMSSCGFPIGPIPGMCPAQVSGLQFWAVIRTLLENCKTVHEAVDYAKEIPIAYNINLMLADHSGEIALLETWNGRVAVKFLGEDGKGGFLHATNHPVLPEIIQYEPKAMRHSLIRYNWIQKQLEGRRNITAEDLKQLLLSEFPEGLNCHCYDEFFGTTKSMVLDPACGTIDICWGGNQDNKWKTYNINDKLKDTVSDINIHNRKFDAAMSEFIGLN